MSKKFNNRSDAKKTTLVETRVLGEPEKVGKIPNNKMLESKPISYLSEYSRKQLRRIGRMKRLNDPDFSKYNFHNNLFVRDQDFNNEIKIVKFEIRGAVLWQI